MSRLTVGSIEGLTENSNVISVPTGHSLNVADAGALIAPGHIIQVVSTTKTDTFSASITGGSTASVTGLSATITPSSTSSKILIMVSLNGARNDGGTGEADVAFQISRDGTSVGSGDAAGSRPGVVSMLDLDPASNASRGQIYGQYLDSPASTSALTYQVEYYARATDTYYVNRSPVDSDNIVHARSQSTITLMEVAG